MDIIKSTKYNDERKLKRISTIERDFSVKFIKESKRDNKRDYLFKCSNKHSFKKNAKSETFFCPKCTLFGTSYSEEIVRGVFEKYSGKKFNKILIKHENNRFELDGYCKELGLAFEHDGRYHYDLDVFLKMTKKTEKDFEELKKRDKRKNKYCKDNGIELIRIKQLYQDCSMDELHTICEKLFNKKRQKVKLNINLNNKYFVEVTNILKKDKCVLINHMGSLSSQDKIEYQCSKGHIHNTSAAKIKHHFKGCPSCNEEKRKKEQLSKIKELSKALKITYIPSEIINRESYVSFNCNGCDREINKPLKRFFDDFKQNNKPCKCVNRNSKNKEQIFIKSFNRYLGIKKKNQRTKKEEVYIFKYENKQKTIINDSKKFLNKKIFDQLKKELRI